MKRFLVGLVLFLVSVPNVVWAWDAFPSLASGSHYAGSGRWNTSQNIEQCLATLSASSKANYFAAIVDNTSRTGSASDNDAVPYVDALSQAWSSQIKPDIDVVMVLGIDNRAIAVHPGSTWASVGFETNEIKATIDGSNFKSLARSQDYAGAVCDLAQTVEARISLLRKGQERVLNVAQAKVGAYRSRIPALQARVSKEVNDPEAVGIARAKLSAAADRVDELVFALGQKYIPDVTNKPALIEQELKSVEVFLQRQSLVDQEFEKFQTRVVAFQGEMLASNVSDEEKRELIQESTECLKLRPSAAQLFDETPFMTTAEACLAGVEGDFRYAVVRHNFWTRVVPSVLLFGLLMGLSIALFVFFRRRRAAKITAHTQLEIWSEKLGQASERLLDLESKFAGYLSGTNARYVGASADLDVLAADAVNLVFLMYDQSVEIQKRARQRFELAPLYRASDFDQCVRMLTTTPISFETGLPEKELRVFLPLTQSFKGTSASVLNELDFRYAEAFKCLSALQSEVDQAMVWATRVQEQLHAIQIATDARLAFGFPVEQYSKELQEITRELKVFLGHVKYDPVAANARAASLLSLMSDLKSRVQSGNRCLHTLITEVTPMAQALRLKITTLRSAGWALREPGFDPDGVLDHSSLMARELREMLATFRDLEAPSLCDQILKEVQTAGDRISVIIKARDAIPRRLSELAQSKTETEGKIPEAREALVRLSNENAVSAFQVQADNLDELEVVLSEVQTRIKKVEQQFSAEHYLAATADSERCQLVLDAGLALIIEIYEAEKHLLELRQQARVWRGESEDFLRRCVAKKDILGVGDGRRVRLKALQEWAVKVFERADEPLPDWRQLHVDMQELHSQLEGLDRESELGRSSAALAQSEFATLRATLESLRERVEAEERDRPHVARFIEQIQSQVSAFATNLSESTQPGEWLEEEVSDLEDLMSQAETLWNSERKIIHDAAMEFSRANEELGRVGRKHYGFGISPSLGAAKALLTQAELASNTRRWEEVFSQSQAALQLIKLEEKARDREHQDREDARVAAAAAAAAAIEARRQQSANPGRSNLSSPSDFSSSSGSSSSSGGSSFGSSSSSSSSSGGSSW